MDKTEIICALTMIGILALGFYVWASANVQVNNARTPEELRVACSGFTIQNAPVRCLEVVNR